MHVLWGARVVRAEALGHVEVGAGLQGSPAG